MHMETAEMGISSPSGDKRRGGQGGAEWLEVSGDLEMKDVTRGDGVGTQHSTEQIRNSKSPESPVP